MACDVTQSAHLRAAKSCWGKLVESLEYQGNSIPKIKINKKIRIGYLSGDFRNHAVGYLFVGIPESHNKNNFEIYGYSNSADDGGEIRDRLRKGFDQFLNVFNLSDEELASQIKSDEIDILVDLSGVTAETRIKIMALRPAPIQMTWLGMPGSSGADCIDYLIGDSTVVDEKNRNGFSENIIQLPNCYQPNDPQNPINLNVLNRKDYGLPSDAVVYCCFNQLYKLSPDTLVSWSKILNHVPNSIIWLLSPNDVIEKRVLNLFNSFGIPSNKVVFAKNVKHEEHILRLCLADLMLDNLTYNAHTTCSDALRVGTPVLTLPGITFASRVAKSILNTCELFNYITSNYDEYVEVAIQFGLQSREEIDFCKKTVLNKYWSSPMPDAKTFALNLEKAYLISLDKKINAAHSLDITLEDIISFNIDDFYKKYKVNILENNEKQIIKSTFDRSLDGLISNQDLETRDSNCVNIASDSVDTKLPSWTKSLLRSGSRARLENLKILKNEVIRLKESPLMLDVGAAPEGIVGHEILAKEGLIRVLGFEPDPACFSQLRSDTHSHFLPIALGDGTVKPLYLCMASGMNSIYEPNHDFLSLFPGFSYWGTVKEVIQIETKRLDDIPEALMARFAKLDIQGAEKLVLENGISVLQELSLLQIEASPSPLYKNEPSFFEIGYWLEKQGFVLHTLSNENKRSFAPYGTEENPYSGCNHLFQVDAVFIPNPLVWKQLSEERLKCLAFFAHAMYKSYDVAVRALAVLDERNGSNQVQSYREYLEIAGFSS